MRVYVELQLHFSVLGVDFEQCVFDRIVDAVVNVKTGRIGVAHTRTAHIGFVRKNECGCHLIDRNARALVVIADG